MLSERQGHYFDWFMFMLCFAYFLLIAHTFFLAYDNKCKCVMVYIDRFGEANFEAWLLVVMGGIFITYSLYKLYLVCKRK